MLIVFMAYNKSPICISSGNYICIVIIIIIITIAIVMEITEFDIITAIVSVNFTCICVKRTHNAR